MPSTHAGGFEGSALHRLLVVLIALKVFVLIVAFDPVGLQAFELPKAQLGRALAWPMAATLALALLRSRGEVLPRSPLHAFVLAFLAANCVSALVAESPYVALYGERGSYLGLTFLLDMIVLYLAAAVALRRIWDWLIVGGGALAGFGSSLVYAVIQFVGIDPYEWTADTRRPIGTFGSTVRFAQFLAVAFISALAIVLFTPNGRWRDQARASGMVVAFAAVTLAGVVGSRNFFVGLAAGLVALLVIAWRVWLLTPVRLVQLGALVTLTGIASLVLLLGTPAGARLTARVADLAAEDRLQIYATAVEAFQDRPLTGFGPDNFTPAYAPNRVPGTRALGDILENSAHNWVLQTAVTLGALGLVALLALLVAWWRTVWNGLAAGRPFLLAMLGAGGVAYWAGGLVSVGSQSVDWIPWLALGATVAAVGTASRRGEWISMSRLVQVAILLSLSVPALTVAAALEANRAAWTAARAYERQDAPTASTAAGIAVELDGGRAEHWNWLGLAATLSSDWKLAGEAYARAAALAPYDSTYWQNLARARLLQSLSGDQTSGGPGAAIDAARWAVEVEPVELSSHELLAEVSYSLGHPEIALEAAVASLEYGGGVPDETIAKAARAMSDQARARQYLERFLALRESVPLRLALANAALKLNDLTSARAHAQRVLELDASNLEAMKILRDTGG